MLKSIGSNDGRVVAVTLALALAVAVAAGVVARQTARAQNDAEAAVRAALMKSTLSFERNDRAMAAEVWAGDESLTVFEQGHANYGWTDYRDHHLFPEMGEMKNTKYALSDIKVHLAGKTAWATFKYTIAGDVTEAGRTRHAEGGGLGTAVLEERQGRWQIVHWHSSAPRRAPVPTASPAK
jgi:ketosteroid isomerase-like protein